MQNRNIIEFFNQLIEQSGSYDIALVEFQHRIDDDENLNQQYLEWCEAEGLTPREGFDVFCTQYRSDKDSVWESLNDYDE